MIDMIWYIIYVIIIIIIIISRRMIKTCASILTTSLPTAVYEFSKKNIQKHICGTEARYSIWYFDERS